MSWKAEAVFGSIVLVCVVWWFNTSSAEHSAMLNQFKAWVGYVPQPPTPWMTNEEAADWNAKLHPAEKVKMPDFKWHTSGLGMIMLLDFTVRNDSDFAVKDITIKCSHYGKSGTMIDSNTRTIYEVIPAYGTMSKSKWNMGFIHDQADESACKVTGYVPLERSNSYSTPGVTFNPDGSWQENRR